MQLVERRHVTGYVPKYRAVAGLFAENVDPEAAAFRCDIGEVQIASCVESFLLVLRQDLEHVSFEFGIRQLPELNWHQVAIHAQHRRHADGEMHIRAALGETEFEKCVDTSHLGRNSKKSDGCAYPMDKL